MEAPILGAPSFWLEAFIPCASTSNPGSFVSNSLPSCAADDGSPSSTPCFASPPRDGARSFRVSGSPPPLEPSGRGGSQWDTSAATPMTGAVPSQAPPRPSVGEHEHVISWKIFDASSSVLEVREDCPFGCSKSVSAQGGQDAGAGRGGARPAGAPEGSRGSAAHSLTVRIVFDNQRLLSAFAADGASSAGAREDAEPALVGAMSAPSQPKSFTLFVVSDRGDIFSFAMDIKGPGVDLLPKAKPQTHVKQRPGRQTQAHRLPEGSTWVLPDASFSSPAVKRLDPSLAARLGMLTCAGATEGAVCLGGTAGAVLWIPLTAAPRFGPLSPGGAAGAAAKGFVPAVELRDSPPPAARGLLGGWGRGGGQSEAGAVPVLALRPIIGSNKKGLLLVARADSTLQLWDPSKKLKLGQTRVEQPGAPQADPGAGGVGILAHQMRLLGAETEEGESLLLASWQAWAGAGDPSSAPIAGPQQSPPQTPVPAVRAPPETHTRLSLFGVDLGDGLEAAQSTALDLDPLWHTTELPAGLLVGITVGASDREAWALFQRSGAPAPGTGTLRPGATASAPEPLEAAAGLPAVYHIRSQGPVEGPSADAEVEQCVLVEDTLVAASGIPLGPLATLCSSLVLEDVVPEAKEGALRQALAGALLSPGLLFGPALEEVVESSRRASLAQPGSFQAASLRPLSELSFGALRRELAAAVHHLEKQVGARGREQGAHGYTQGALPLGPLRTIQAWQALVRAYLAALCQRNAPCCLLRSTTDPAGGATYIVRHQTLSVVRCKDTPEVLLGQADPLSESPKPFPLTQAGISNGSTTRPHGNSSTAAGSGGPPPHVRLLQRCMSLIRQRVGPIVLGVLRHKLLAHPGAARGAFAALAGFLELGETRPALGQGHGHAGGGAPESSFSRGAAAGHAKAKQLRASHRMFSTEFEACLRALGEAGEGEGEAQSGWGPVLASVQEILNGSLESPSHGAETANGMAYSPAPPPPASVLAPALAAVSESRLELLMCLTTLLHFLAARRTPVLGLSSSQALLLADTLIPCATAHLRTALALHHLAHTFRAPSPEDGDAGSAFAEDLLGLSLSEGGGGLSGNWAGPGWSPLGGGSTPGAGLRMPGGGVPAQQGVGFGGPEAQGLKGLAGLKSVVRRPRWAWAAPDRTLLCLILSTPPLPALETPLPPSGTAALSPSAFLAAAAQCLDLALAQPPSGSGTPAENTAAGAEAGREGEMLLGGGTGRLSREETPTDGEEVPGMPGPGPVASPQGELASLQTQGLRLGLKLLDRSQFPSMKVILELLGDGSADCAPAPLSSGSSAASTPAARAARSFLLGFATLAAHPEDATSLVPLTPPLGPEATGQQAARHFFAAANGVGLKAARGEQGQGGSAAEAASSVLGITSYLEGSFLAGPASQGDMFAAYSVEEEGDEGMGRDMDTGAGEGPVPKTWEVSRKVRYYEAVMRLLERYGQSQLAVLFASAALELIDQTCKPSSAREGAQALAGYTGEVLRTAGRLWTALFKAHLAAGRLGEAFCAVASNPEPIDRQICLRRFVMRLFELWSENTHTHSRKPPSASLLLPPFGSLGPHGTGAVPQPGGAPQVGPTAVLLGLELPLAAIGLEREVVAELEWRCANSGVEADPSPHKALYAFHAARGNWAQGAAIMYAFAQRLRHALARHGPRAPASSGQQPASSGALPTAGFAAGAGRRYRQGGVGAGAGAGAAAGVPAADRVRQEALRVKEEAALRGRGAFLLEECERSLALAIGCLALLPAHQAWIRSSTPAPEAPGAPPVHPSAGGEPQLTLGAGAAGAATEAQWDAPGEAQTHAQGSGVASSSGLRGSAPGPGLGREDAGVMSPEATPMDRDRGTPEQQEQRKRSRLDVGLLRKGGEEEGAQGPGGMLSKGGRRVVNAGDMRKELAAVTAALALHRSSRTADPVTDLSVGSLVPALTEKQQYTAALSLLRAVVEPGTQAARHYLVLVFGRFARSCCEFQLQGGASRPTPLAGPSVLSPGQKQQQQPGAAPLLAQLGGAAGEGDSLSWEKLRGALEEFCCWHPALRAVVARAILSSHPLLPLPPWLVDMFTAGVPAPAARDEGLSAKGPPAVSLGQRQGQSGVHLCARDPYGLMEVYLEFGGVLDACQLALAELSRRDAERRGSLPGAKRFLASYVRHATLDKVLSGLREAKAGGGAKGRGASDVAVLDSLTSALERAMQEQLRLVVRDSEDFRELK